jgi:hypothetical protein
MPLGQAQASHVTPHDFRPHRCPVEQLPAFRFRERKRVHNDGIERYAKVKSPALAWIFGQPASLNTGIPDFGDMWESDQRRVDAQV